MRYLTAVLVCVGLSTTGSANGQSLTGSCVWADPSKVGVILGPDIPAPVNLTPGEPISAGFRVQTKAENRAGIYLAVGAAPNLVAEATLCLQPNTVIEIRSGRTSGPPSKAPLRGVEVSQGVLVVRYIATDKVPLVLAAKGKWARVAEGSTLIVNVNASSTTFELGEGGATVFDGPFPEGEVTSVAGGQTLTPQASVRDEATKLMGSLYRAGIAKGHSDWLDIAERGDLLPALATPSAATVAALAAVGVTAVTTPAIAAVTTPTNVSPITTPSVAVSQIQALLTSGNPASVVVGVRLERTRIVGSPSTAGGPATLRFNTQARSPLKLSTPR